MWATNPTPQASRSWRGSYKPCCIGKEKLTTAYLNQIKLCVENCCARQSGSRIQKTRLPIWHRTFCALPALRLLRFKRPVKAKKDDTSRHTYCPCSNTKAKGLESYL
jgi:hypothetical protein